MTSGGLNSTELWNLQLQGRVDSLEKTLRWYAERAESIKRYMEAKPPKQESIIAVMTELALDGGERSRAALKTNEIPEGLLDE